MNEELRQQILDVMPDYSTNAGAHFVSTGWICEQLPVRTQDVFDAIDPLVGSGISRINRHGFYYYAKVPVSHNDTQERESGNRERNDSPPEPTKLTLDPRRLHFNTEVISVLTEKQAREKATCAVRAVSCTTKTEYTKTWEMFRDMGRKTGCRTPNGITKGVIRLLGYKLEPWTVDAKTVRTVERELPTKGSFLIWVPHHVLARVDGHTYDWAANRLKRVKEVHRIVPVKS